MGSYGDGIVEEDSGSEHTRVLEDVPMSQFLAEPDGFSFQSNQLHVDLGINEPIPMLLGPLIAGTDKADVQKANCSNLNYFRRLVCKSMKVQQKEKNMIEPGDLRCLRHVHVVAFVGTFTFNHQFYVLMYPHAKTDLAKFMAPISNWLNGEPFRDSHIPIVSGVEKLDLLHSASVRISHLRNFFACLTQALCYLHQEHVKHKDIKPANILIDRFNSPMLADFDISHRYTDDTQVSTTGRTLYTPLYAAPEVIDYGPRPFASDVFSLGCVFSEMITLIMGQSLTNFLAYRGGQDDAPFHRSIDKTQTWLQKLCDPVSVKQLQLKNNNASQIIPAEATDRDGPFVTAVETICTMLNVDPKNRERHGGNAGGFRGIMIATCEECMTQSSAVPVTGPEDFRPDTIEDRIEAVETVDQQNSQSDLVHLQVPSTDKRIPSSHKAMPNHIKPPPRVPRPAGDRFDESGRLTLRQKLREAIGYEPQGRQWKIHEVSELETYEGSWVDIKPFRTSVELKIGDRIIGRAKLSGLPFLPYMRCYLGRVKRVYVIGRSGIRPDSLAR